MKKENNFIDFLKQYNIDESIITGVKDFIEDIKQTHLYNKKDLIDKEIFEDLNSRSMCREAQIIYKQLKLEYLDFINDVE